MRTVVAITGASGTAVGVEFLKRCPGEKFLIISRWGKAVLHQETGLVPEDLSPYIEKIFSGDDLSAPFASGTIPFDQYVILPCSLSTLGRIANGIGENLVARVGEVALKENRRMILGLRESPLSAIALENALKLSRLGVTIMPLCPPFYFKSLTNEETIGRFVDHLLTTLNLPSEKSGWRQNAL
ncbi:MAG: Flavin prenyltransferase UbiX [Elusimicrobia bacterium]|nr:Flavin prenyltransferase UbiX [Elusimicrobiota bacterium]